MLFKEEAGAASAPGTPPALRRVGHAPTIGEQSLNSPSAPAVAGTTTRCCKTALWSTAATPVSR